MRAPNCKRQCPSGCGLLSLDTIRLVVLWRIHLRRHGCDADCRVDAQIDRRIFAGEPRLEAFLRLYHGHAGVKTADAVAGIGGKNGARACRPSSTLQARGISPSGPKQKSRVTKIAQAAMSAFGSQSGDRREHQLRGEVASCDKGENSCRSYDCAHRDAYG